jgi:M6 family metalloprotease-like protein
LTPIEEKFRGLSPELKREFGSTADVESEDGVRGGRFRLYSRGAIYWHPTTGAHEIHGQIYDRYNRMNSHFSILGYPTTDQLPARDRVGRFNHFMGGSIYWSPQTEAHSIHGPIKQKWEDMGAETGSLGYPISEADQTLGGETRQKLQFGTICWSHQTGAYVISEPKTIKRRIKVFLVRYKDLKNPKDYTKSFFEDLMFSANKLSKNPDGGPISGSVFDYFYGLSDGNFRLEGEVTNWIDVPLEITKLVHGGRSDGQLRPNLPAIDTQAGTIVASLRKQNVRTKEDLKVGGEIPDGLVFLHIDVRGGGAMRYMSQMKQSLQEYGRLDLWDSSWDSWSDMKVMSVPCCALNPMPQPRIDGTIERVPDVSELRWYSTTVIMHELGHLLLGYRDLYGEHYAYWGDLELMGTSRPNDFPQPIGSYLQELGGWFNSNNMSRQTHNELVLDQLETHSVALRLQNGSLGSRETITLENRGRKNYNNTPPNFVGNGLLAYRIISKLPDPSIDSGERHIIPREERGRAVPVIRRMVVLTHPGDWRDTWGIAADNRNIMGTGQQFDGTSLNHLGELWWEFRNIQILDGGSIRLDAVYQPLDLLRSYTKAIWTNGDKYRLTPDFYHRDQGNVMMINRSPPIENGVRYNHVLNLHPQWKPYGQIIGHYTLPIPESGARLYLTVALSEQATRSTGFTFRVLTSRLSELIKLAEVDITPQRNIRTIVIDMNEWRGTTIKDLMIEVNAGSGPSQDWCYLLEAFLVPTTSVLYDFINESPSAYWHGNKGQIKFGDTGDLSLGEVKKSIFAFLQNGYVYGQSGLLTIPARQDKGFVEGRYKITIPARRSVFRAEVGFDERSYITSSGAKIFLKFISSEGTERSLLHDATLERKPAIGETGVLQNPVTSIAVPIPVDLHGREGEFIIRVYADSSLKESLILWTMARLTEN